MSILDSTFEQTFAFFNNFLVKKSVRVISSLYCCHNLVARHYRLGGKILTAFIRCLVIYVKPCPIISQTIGRSAVIPRALTDLLTYRLTYPLARHFELAWAGNICNELLWRKLKLIGIFFCLFLHPVEYWFSCLVGRLLLCQASPKITASPALIGRTTVTMVWEVVILHTVIVREGVAYHVQYELVLFFKCKYFLV